MFESLEAFIDFIGGAIQDYVVRKVEAVTVGCKLRLHAFGAYVIESGT